MARPPPETVSGDHRHAWKLTLEPRTRTAHSASLRPNQISRPAQQTTTSHSTAQNQKVDVEFMGSPRQLHVVREHPSPGPVGAANQDRADRVAGAAQIECVGLGFPVRPTERAGQLMLWDAARACTPEQLQHFPFGWREIVLVAYWRPFRLYHFVTMRAFCANVNRFFRAIDETAFFVRSAASRC